MLAWNWMVETEISMLLLWYVTSILFICCSSFVPEHLQGCVDVGCCSHSWEDLSFSLKVKSLGSLLGTWRIITQSDMSCFFFLPYTSSSPPRPRAFLILLILILKTVFTCFFFKEMWVTTGFWKGSRFLFILVYRWKIQWSSMWRSVP